MIVIALCVIGLATPAETISAPPPIKASEIIAPLLIGLGGAAMIFGGIGCLADSTPACGIAGVGLLMFFVGMVMNIGNDW